MARKLDRKPHILVIIENEQGRPCGWGLAMTREAALAEAERQWKLHVCDPGERRGKTIVNDLELIIGPVDITAEV
jgi:hypothetical protein